MSVLWIRPIFPLGLKVHSEQANACPNIHTVLYLSCFIPETRLDVDLLVTYIQHLHFFPL